MLWLFAVGYPGSLQRRQHKLRKKLIVALLRLPDLRLYCFQFGMHRLETDLPLRLCSADVAGNVEVVVVVDDLLHRHAARVAFNRFFWALLVGINDALDVPVAHLVLPLSLRDVLRAASFDDQPNTRLLSSLYSQDS